MNAGTDFSSRIVVKTNFAEVLRSELPRPSWRRERVAIGPATDAHQPRDGRYRITRGVLAALVAFRTPAAAAATAHGASSFGASVLRLAPPVREHDLGPDAAAYPDLLPRHERAFAGTNARPDYLAAIERRIARIRERHGFADDAMRRRHLKGTEQEAGGYGGGAHERQMVLPLGVNGMRDGVSSGVALARG